MGRKKNHEVTVYREGVGGVVNHTFHTQDPEALIQGAEFVPNRELLQTEDLNGNPVVIIRIHGDNGRSTFFIQDCSLPNQD